MVGEGRGIVKGGRGRMGGEKEADLDGKWWAKVYN